MGFAKYVCVSVTAATHPSLHAWYMPRRPCCRRTFCVLLLLIYQATWACTQLLQTPCCQQSLWVVLLECAKCVCCSSNAAKPSCMLHLQKPLLQRRLLSSSASAHPGPPGMHTAAGSRALLSHPVLCMLSAPVCGKNKKRFRFSAMIRGAS